HHLHHGIGSSDRAGDRDPAVSRPQDGHGRSPGSPQRMNIDPGTLTLVSLLLPAAAFLSLAIVAPLRRDGRPAAYLSVLFAAGALVAAILSWRAHAGGAVTRLVWEW